MKKFQPPKPPIKPPCFDEERYRGFDAERKIISTVESLVKEYPNLSPANKKFSESEKYKHYLDLPERIFDSVLYTYHVIRTKLEHVNWYHNIIFYIDSCIENLGYPTIGKQVYKSYVDELLNSHFFNYQGITEEQKNKLIKLSNWLPKREKINLELAERQEKIYEVDKLYKSFLKSIPEDIPYFAGKKKLLEKQAPFVLIVVHETDFGNRGFVVVNTEPEVDFLSIVDTKID